MTKDDINFSLWILAFLFLISIIMFVLLYSTLAICLWFARYISNPRERTVVLAGLMVGLPLGFTGIVAGFLTGSSRSPAVSALVPAILTFIGLIVVYMLGKGRLRAAIAGFAVFIFSVNLLVGTVLGSASRDRHEEELTSVRVRELKADEEFKVRLYCKGLGLVSDVSKPCPLEVVPAKQSEADTASRP
jgi:amino acid transporter